MCDVRRVCIMFIHSHVSDDYLLKELTIPCNLPSKSTFVRHIQLYYSWSKKNKTPKEYKSNTFRDEKKRNDRKTTTRRKLCVAKERENERIVAVMWMIDSLDDEKGLYITWILPLYNLIFKSHDVSLVSFVFLFVSCPNKKYAFFFSRLCSVACFCSFVSFDSETNNSSNSKR